MTDDVPADAVPRIDDWNGLLDGRVVVLVSNVGDYRPLVPFPRLFSPREGRFVDRSRHR
jgi:hypothetical protein